MRCARCHDHKLTGPEDTPRWTQADAFGIYALLSEFDNGVSTERKGAPRPTRFVLDGVVVDNLPAWDAKLEDRRTAFAEAFVASRAFKRATAYRIWAELGLSFIDPNQFTKANLDAVTVPEFLDALTDTFSNEGTSLRRFLRVILKSKVYQLTSCGTTTTNDKYLARFIVRRQHAETLLAGGKQMVKFEPVAALLGGKNAPYTDNFGRSERDSVTSRHDGVALDQAMYQLNSKAAPGQSTNYDGFNQLVFDVDKNNVSFEDASRQIVRWALSREPTAEEMTAIAQMRQESATTP